MRALHTIVAFLLAILLLPTGADAHVPLWAPRVSLSLALDWNLLARAAVATPRRRLAPPVAHRHQVPRLTVTAAAPAPAQLQLAAFGRVEQWTRKAITPGYVEPNPDHRQKFRQVYVMPFAPYVGSYGLLVTVETDRLLR